MLFFPSLRRANVLACDFGVCCQGAPDVLSHLISVPGTRSFISAVAKMKRGSRCVQYHATNTWLHAGLALPSTWLMRVLSVGALTNTLIFPDVGQWRSSGWVGRCWSLVCLLEVSVRRGGLCQELLQPWVVFWVHIARALCALHYHCGSCGESFLSHLLVFLMPPSHSLFTLFTPEALREPICS